jgi:hypothetical protein
MSKQWHEPPTETIILLDGTTAEAHINGYGRSLNDGWIFVNGREVYVKRSDDGSWREVEQS